MTARDHGGDQPCVSYSTDGAGRWRRREYRRQCPEGVMLTGRCQGTLGHKGVHWGYTPGGSFCYDDNADDPTGHGCSGSIPPGHKDYRTPEEMAPHYHMAHFEDSTVTDPAEIARLERGDVRPGESTSRPRRRTDRGP